MFRKAESINTFLIELFLVECFSRTPPIWVHFHRNWCLQSGLNLSEWHRYFLCTYSVHLPLQISKVYFNIEYNASWTQAIRFTFLLKQMRHKPEAPIPHTSFTIYFSMLINATQMFLGNNLVNQWGETEKSDGPNFHSTFDNLQVKC